jgi:hypothetical protein
MCKKICIIVGMYRPYLQHHSIIVNNGLRPLYPLLPNSLLLLLPSAVSPRLQLSRALRQFALKLSHLLFLFLLLFLHLLLLHLRLADLLTLQLFGATLCDISSAQIAEQKLEHHLNKVARDVVNDHHRRHGRLEVVCEGNEFHLLVELGDELSGAGEGDGGDAEDAVEHALVLRERLAEGAALVVYGEGGDLLDELEEVDCAVEERGGELGFEVDDFGAAVGDGLARNEEEGAGNSRFKHVAVPGDVDQGGDVNGKLAEDRSDDVEVEDVGLWPLLGEAFHRPSA